MLEDSASEQVCSAERRLYHDLPAATILATSPRDHSTFVSSTETAATVLANIAKIGALTSLPVGIVLVTAYLHSEGAPLPAADSSISVLFSLVCVIFLFITLVLASIFLLPAVAEISSGSKAGSSARVISAQEKKAIGRVRLGQGASEYYLRFGPFLSFVLFFFLRVILVGHPNWSWVGVTIGIASFVGYCRFYFLNRRRQVDYVIVQSNAQSLSSFIALFLLILTGIQSADPRMPIWAVAFLCVVVPAVVHLMVVKLVTSWNWPSCCIL